MSKTRFAAPRVRRVLVLGGTGFVGRHLCARLAGAGMELTVPTRRRANARELLPLSQVWVTEADVHDEATLRQLMPGHDAVVNLVAVLHGDAARFEHVHVELPRRIAQACVASGVRRLVHVSALGADPQGPSLYQRSKAAGEAVLEAAGLDLTVLRPSVIFGAGDRFLNLFAALQAWLPVMPLARANTRFQPVWVEDVAAAIEACLRDAATLGRHYECAGPQTWALAELVQLAGRFAGHERAVIPLPDALGALQAGVMELMPGEPMMSRDNLASLRVDNIASGEAAGLHELGIAPASLLAVAPTYLGLRGPRSRLDTLRRTAGRG